MQTHLKEAEVQIVEDGATDGLGRGGAVGDVVRSPVRARIERSTGWMAPAAGDVPTLAIGRPMTRRRLVDDMPGLLRLFRSWTGLLVEARARH